MFDYEVEEIGSSDISSDFFLPIVKIREITNIKEKRKWMDYFVKGYSGSVIGLQPQVFGKFCKFFVASVDGKDAGFIRISNSTDVWSKYYDGNAWNASDAYVKKPYRNNSVLRQLLEYVIKNCDVVSVRLETKRLFSNSHYYKTLGFTYAWTFGDEELSIAVLDKLKNAAVQKNDDFENGN